MKKFRVECNYGSKYFDEAVDAVAYYNKCKAKHRDVEIWIVAYCYCDKLKRVAAVQELLDYSCTALPKS